MVFSSLAASIYPKLFHSLVLIDPVINQPSSDMEFSSKSALIQGVALSRRDTWSSRQVDLKKKSYYKLLLKPFE
jgi:hypothetical protein